MHLNANTLFRRRRPGFGWRVSVYLLRRNGIDDVPLMVRHWTIRVWSVVFTLSVLLSFYTAAPWDDTREGC